MNTTEYVIGRGGSPVKGWNLSVRHLCVGALASIALADFVDLSQYISALPKWDATPILVFLLRAVGLLALVVAFFRKRKLLLVDWPPAARILFSAWCVWTALSLVRGAIAAPDYWAWRFLAAENVFRYSVHFFAFLGAYAAGFRAITRFVFGWVLVLALPSLYFSGGKGEYLYPYLVMPVTLFGICIAYLPRRQRWLALITIVLAVASALYFRSNVARLCLATSLGSLYVGRRYVHVNTLKAAFVLLFFAPPFVLYTAISGGTNPLDVMSQIEIARLDVSAGREENFTADTRTFLYKEVLDAVLENDWLIFGGGASADYKSVYFDYLVDGERRFAAEVGFLNILLNCGLVGVALYGAILATASYYSIWRSRNWLCRALGIFLAFRWGLFFIEDITGFNLNMSFHWLAIGLAYSRQFRKLSDMEVAGFFRSIFCSAQGFALRKGPSPRVS